MTQRPLIGMPGRRRKGKQITDLPENLADIEVDLFFTDYSRGVLEAGGMPVYLPFGIDADDLVARLDGIILPGGADINPQHYGADAETDRFPPEAIRDDLELALAEAAIATGTPMLGICRGIQIVNVQAGGTLHQDVPPHARFDLAPSAQTHEVTIDPASTLGRIYGPSRHVNSLHHQTIDRVGEGFVATAHAEDGTIEGLEHLELPIVSVQWHPEMMTERSSDPLFRWIVEQAHAFARS